MLVGAKGMTVSGNGKVFVSHAHEDNERCMSLLTALDAWGVDYWFDAERLDAGHDLSAHMQQAISDRDTFIRICTPAAKQSFWVSLETNAFRGLQAKEHQAGQPQKRLLINLILDPGYAPEPFDYAYVFIDATSKPPRDWMQELGRALQGERPTTAATNPGDQPKGNAAILRQIETLRQRVRLIQARMAPTTAPAATPTGTPNGPQQASQAPTIQCLVVRRGNDKGKVFTVHANYMGIGTGPTMPIQLHDERVNPFHAAIQRDPKGMRHVLDVGSKTGTFVNGQLIDSKCALKEGDEIQVGDTVLLFTYHSASQPK